MPTGGGYGGESLVFLRLSLPFVLDEEAKNPWGTINVLWNYFARKARLLNAAQQNFKSLVIVRTNRTNLGEVRYINKLYLRKNKKSIFLVQKMRHQTLFSDNQGCW